MRLRMTSPFRALAAGLSLAVVATLAVAPAYADTAHAATVPEAAGATATSLDAPVALPAAAASPDRIAGSNRYATAADLASKLPDSHYNIVLANGTNDKEGFDALAANYVAGVKRARLLLTDSSNSLPAATRDAILKALRLGKGKQISIVVMGGTDSVSSAVVRDVDNLANTVLGTTDKSYVTRVGGSSRYETAVKAATLGGDITGAFIGKTAFGSGALQKTAILASGETNADALAAGPLSYALRLPIFLTPSRALPRSVAITLKAQGIENLIVMGQNDRIKDSVVKSARNSGVVNVKRIGGSSRYNTAAELYDFAHNTLVVNNMGGHYGDGATRGKTVYLANGRTGFPDALAAAALAGSQEDALLTVPQNTLPSETRKFLAGAQGVNKVIALGAATDNISEQTLQAAASAVR